MKKIILPLIFLFLFSCVSFEKEDEEIKTSKNKIEYDDLVPPIKSWCLPHESDPHRVHLNFKNREGLIKYQEKFCIDLESDIEFAWFVRCMTPSQEFIPFCLYKDIHENRDILNIRDSNWRKTKRKLNCKDTHEGEVYYLSFMLPSPATIFKKDDEPAIVGNKEVGEVDDASKARGIVLPKKQGKKKVKYGAKPARTWKYER
jgi:hypothetical protein